jgi:hypothetical protein
MIRFLLAGMILFGGGAAHAQMPPEIEARLPPPYFRVYVIAVCAASEDITDDCMNEGLRNAAYALSEMYLRAYRGQLNWNSLRLRFPYGWAEASQTRFLRDVERKGVELASDKIARDGAPGGDERLENWRLAAYAEAASGGNWLHEWSEYRHDFAPSHVTRQLVQADIRR